MQPLPSSVDLQKAKDAETVVTLHTTITRVLHLKPNRSCQSEPLTTIVYSLLRQKLGYTGASFVVEKCFFDIDARIDIRFCQFVFN